jgi:hypothetical protein
MIEKFNFTGKAKSIFIAIGAIGLALIIIGSLVDMGPGQNVRFWANFLLCNFIFLSFSVIAIAWMAIQYLAKASWPTALKRIPEAIAGYLGIGIIAMIVLFLASFIGDHKNGLYSLYSWIHIERPEVLHDRVFINQRPLLNFWTFILFSLACLGFYYFVRQRMRNASLREDREGGLTFYNRQSRLSELYMPIFALSFCTIVFMWLMSLEPKWYSTMYAVNIFIGGFVSTITTIYLIAVILKKNNYMSYVNNNHFHDLGKFMFGFSIFWVYTWLAQFLLIWYANLPVETIYFIKRMHGTWLVLFWCNLTINFFMPFLALMMRESKRQYNYTVVIACMMLIGRYIDWYLAIMPGSAGVNSGFGFYEIGFLLFFGGIFAYTVAYKLSRANLVVMNHPFIEESFHHEI